MIRKEARGLDHVNSFLMSEFLYSKYFGNYWILNIELAHYLVNEFNSSIKIQIKKLPFKKINK